ncbi:MAG: hydrogenase maturation protease [Polyangiaceae bacterium]|nr:hydrogenase maturation protease [Polyangiaceae bacterium]
MTRATRIVGIGQPFAGDDGVGLAVVNELEQMSALVQVSFVQVSFARVADAMGLLPLIESSELLVVVDAVLASPAGQVKVLDVDELSSFPSCRASSHGFGVAKALGLGTVLYPAETREIRIVAVCIDRPRGYAVGLSPVVADAVRVAAARVLSLVASCAR